MGLAWHPFPLWGALWLELELSQNSEDLSQKKSARTGSGDHELCFLRLGTAHTPEESREQEGLLNKF